MSTAKKRQAFEVIAEIEQKWRKRCRFMMWSWSVEHLDWLIKRWDFKNPGDSERRMVLIKVMTESIACRQRACINHAWLYMHKEHIRELMQGAGLNTSQPEYVSKVTDLSVVELPQRAREAVAV